MTIPKNFNISMMMAMTTMSAPVPSAAAAAANTLDKAQQRHNHHHHPQYYCNVFRLLRMSCILLSIIYITILVVAFQASTVQQTVQKLELIQEQYKTYYKQQQQQQQQQQQPEAAAAIEQWEAEIRQEQQRLSSFALFHQILMELAIALGCAMTLLGIVAVVAELKVVQQQQKQQQQQLQEEAAKHDENEFHSPHGVSQQPLLQVL